MNTWSNFEDGSTIGTKGCEGGIIILDIEYSEGARISLEENVRVSPKGKLIPYAITFGIYGVMFHTHFENKLELAKEYVNQTKSRIEETIKLYNVEQDKRDEAWNQQHDKQMDELVQRHEHKLNETEKPIANNGFVQQLRNFLTQLFSC